MAEPWTPQLQRWLHKYSGIVPIKTLVGFGCKRRDAYRLADTDDFEMIMPGILRSTHWPLGPMQLMTAACFRNPKALVCYTTAAMLWRFRGLPVDDGHVHILVPHGRHPSMPGVIVTQCRLISDVDIVHRSDGIRLTSPTRTLFDCADLLGVKRATSILEQLINQNSGTFVTHASTVARLGKAGRAGTRTMKAVIAARPAWRAALQSELEVIVLGEIERQGLPTPVVQMWFTLPTGERVRLDFAWPDLKAALEVDHPFWHAGADSSHRDKRRDLKMGTVGWHTMRITDLDVERGLRTSISDVHATLALR